MHFFPAKSSFFYFDCLLYGQKFDLILLLPTVMCDGYFDSCVDSCVKSCVDCCLASCVDSFGNVIHS